MKLTETERRNKVFFIILAVIIFGLVVINVIRVYPEYIFLNQMDEILVSDHAVIKTEKNNEIALSESELEYLKEEFTGNVILSEDFNQYQLSKAGSIVFTSGSKLYEVEIIQYHECSYVLKLDGIYFKMKSQVKDFIVEIISNHT